MRCTYSFISFSRHIKRLNSIEYILFYLHSNTTNIFAVSYPTILHCHLFLFLATFQFRYCVNIHFRYTQPRQFYQKLIPFIHLFRPLHRIVWGMGIYFSGPIAKVRMVSKYQSGNHKCTIRSTTTEYVKGFFQDRKMVRQNKQYI